MAIKDMVDKEFSNKSSADILKSPVSALKGLSDKDAELLKKAFNVKTVKDLATLKYAKWAKEITALAEKGVKEPRPSLKDKVDKAFEKKSPVEIAKAKVDALQGLSSGDAKLLDQAFKVKTVKDLAGLKFYNWAVEIMEAASKPAVKKTPAAKVEKKVQPKEKIEIIEKIEEKTISIKPEKEKKGGFGKFILPGVLILVIVCAAVIFLVNKDKFLPKKQQETTVSDAAQTEIKKDEASNEVLQPEKVPSADSSAVKKDSAASKVEPVKKETVTNPADKTAPADSGNMIVVEKGDTLYSLSKKYLGNSKDWKKIVDANPDKLKDPKKLAPGMKLVMPK